MTLAQLIQIRNALAIAKPYVDNHSKGSEEYMAVLKALSLASALVELLSEKIKVEVTQ